MSTWAKNPATALPLFSYCFLSPPHISKSSCFLVPFSTLFSCSFSSWLQRIPRPRSRASKIKALHSPPHPPKTTSLVTLRPVNSGLQKNCSHMEPTPMGCPSSRAPRGCTYKLEYSVCVCMRVWRCTSVGNRE